MRQVPFLSFCEEIEFFRESWHQALERVLESGCFILGEEGRAFEREFADFLDVPGTAVAVANGTEALALSLRALGVSAGDRVVTPSFTAVPTVSAIRQIGAHPVFCDVNDAGLIDPLRLDKCLDSGIKAVIAVHLYGNVVDISAIRQRCAPHGIPIVEDCAQAHGAALASRKAGTLGDVAAFSFYPTKNLGALGDGGCCFSADAKITDRIRRLRMYGFEKFSDYYSVEDGVNSRLDEIQAAFLRVKLVHLESSIAKRRQLAAVYDRELRDARVFPLEIGPDVSHAYHLYVVRSECRDQLRKALEVEGIETKLHYPTPAHRMIAFQQYYKPHQDPLSRSELLASQVLSLPLYPTLPETTVLRICDVVRNHAG